ncbi:MAG: V-type ATP synthase subunit A [Chlamydiia bacterium]|nr:V-type ATP synthase subunit A [Chlamydiia bacterium]
MTTASGKVVKAFGNLIHVEFDGSVIQGGIGKIDIGNGIFLKSEIVEINNDIVKLQCFEDTYGVKVGDIVLFEGELLEVELGPGVLGSVVDGLQNPLDKIKEAYGDFIERGKYFRALDTDKKWNFTAQISVGDIVKAGDPLGFVQEFSIKHKILTPLKLEGSWEVVVIESVPEATIDDVVAVIKKEDEEVRVTLSQKWPVKTKMSLGTKIESNSCFYTGIRVIDTLFPVIKGGSFCTPGPFGAGKTVLQHHFTRWSKADIVVIVACGERAGEITQILKEMTELVDPRSNRPMIERTVLICNTSSMPVAAREASVYTGISIAEYYMHMGLDVLCLADSTSRWAQALRELSGRLEEIPGEEAFPAYLGSRIAQLYERSGMYALNNGDIGSITFGGTVSPSGGNFEEPVTQKTLSVAGAFFGLSRERAGARKFPAIEPMISWSKFLDKNFAQEGKWFEKIVKEAYAIIKHGNEIAQRIEVVGEDGVALEEYMCFLKADLFDFCFLQQNSFDVEDMYSSESKRNGMLKVMGSIFAIDRKFDNAESARTFFVKLKDLCNSIKYVSHDSGEYKEIVRQIDEKINNTR